MKIYCRRDHRVDLDMRPTAGAHFRCNWQAHRGAPECGEYIYWFLQPKPGGGRRLWAVDVTETEMKYFEAMLFDIDQVLEYVGAMRTERRVA